MLTTLAVVAISVAAPATALADPGQTATDSVGTVQVAQPGLTADAAAEAPTGADVNDGAVSDPQATVSVETTPAAGGDQTADGSTGTVQVGGGGNQTADDSTGTVQAAQPGATADGAAGDSQATLSVETTPAAGGDPTADSSTGTVQVGGGGTQTADSSTGTVQAAQPGLTANGAAGDSQATVGVETTPAAGGDQTADGSTGTVQVGGPGSRQLSSVGPTNSRPAASPTSERSPTVAATPRTVGVAGVQRTLAQPQRSPTILRAPAAAQLPLAGLPLSLALLAGLAAIAIGIALRRRWSPVSTA